MEKIIHLIARILMAHIFIMAGIFKLSADGKAHTIAQMSAASIPAADILYWLVIVVEIGVGAALLLGLFTRWSAFILAGFTVLAGILFHTALLITFKEGTEQIQNIMLMKNLALAGGLLITFIHVRHAPYSLDRLIFK